MFQQVEKSSGRTGRNKHESGKRKDLESCKKELGICGGWWAQNIWLRCLALPSRTLDPFPTLSLSGLSCLEEVGCRVMAKETRWPSSLCNSLPTGQYSEGLLVIRIEIFLSSVWGVLYGFSGRLGSLSHQIFQQPCEAGRTGIVPNEGNSGQGMFNSSAKVT